ncbi:hypothetical protein DPMN_163723 [Dreissena polymorpha]|uniref:Uncharacterized protein n=1 Tax=Dreissena polymorpha TaxID=45954 RepID=A0A9D4IT30_DREPO|nr:hypothetical protein DPMN_163723 [Dreissena polymorpha]
MVCTGCCATLDNIITYLFKRLTSKKKKTMTSPQDSQTFLRILELHPEILQQVPGWLSPLGKRGVMHVHKVSSLIGQCSLHRFEQAVYTYNASNLRLYLFCRIFWATAVHS